MKKIFVYFSLLLSPLIHAEEKHLYFMGAGGEPSGSETIFDDNIKSMSKFAKDSSWKTTISINGGHSKTESIINKGFSGSKNFGTFDQKNYDRMLADMKSKILNGTLKSGDKLMVVLETHGAKKLPDQKTHNISFAGGEAKNLETLDGASSTSLDQLSEVIALAEEKGVKLAIMDLSCYSGNTQKLATNRTCVISSTGTDHPGYTGGQINYLFKKVKTDFPGIFTEGLSEGKNLEEVFLSAKENSHASDYPMISNEADKYAREYLYHLMLPFLKHERKYNGFTRKYGHTEAEFDQMVCQIRDDYTDLTNFLNDLDRVQASMHGTEGLRNALTRYRNFQQGYEANKLEIFRIGKLAKEEIEQQYPNERDLFKYEEGSAVLTANYDDSIAFVQKDLDMYRNDPPSYLSKDLVQIQIQKKQEEIKNIQRKKSIQSALKSKFGRELRQQKDLLNQTYSEEALEQTYEMAEEVRKEAKKLYGEIYRQKNSSANNPCRDFKL